jgi:metal-responsive CopG/Arc/MetJ family transcriptional regulator
MPTTRRAVVVTNQRGDRCVTTHVSADLVVRLDALCKERNVTRSTLIRRLLEEALYYEKDRSG